MKASGRAVLPMLVLLLFLTAAHAQSRSALTQIVTVSGNSVPFPNGNGSMHVSFEELIAGSPATVSIVIQGCMTGGTCDTLDTYTTVANAIRSPSISKVYDSFSVTASWTGGTNVKVTINATLSTANNGSGPPSGSAGGDLSGSYPNPSVAQVNGALVPTSKTVVGTNSFGQIVDASSAIPAHTITIPISGAPIGTGTGSVGLPSAPVNFSCTAINSAKIVANASGSMTVDIWKTNAAIPTSSNKISATSPVTLSSAQLNDNSPLTGWTLPVSTNDVFWASVATADGVLTGATVTLGCQ